MVLKSINLKKYLKNIKWDSGKWCTAFDCGQAAVYFVLLFPLILIIVQRYSHFGYTIYIKNILEHTASGGARVIATTNSVSLAQIQVYKICSELDIGNLGIMINPSIGN